MESYSYKAMLCISGCVLIGGIIAFIAFSIWKITSMKDVEARLPRQIERRKDPFSESHKEAVENNDETCYETVSFISPLMILQINYWPVSLLFIFIKLSCNRNMLYDHEPQ